MGVPEADGLFALRLRCGAWMIVGVSSQGCDDRDRPGRLAFHALFVGAWTYWWSGGNPFAFAASCAQVDRRRPGNDFALVRPDQPVAIAAGSRRSLGSTEQETESLKSWRHCCAAAMSSYNQQSRSTLWRRMSGTCCPGASGAGRRSRPGRSTMRTNLTWWHFPSWRVSLWTARP